jgi:hypothetical protein
MAFQEAEAAEIGESPLTIANVKLLENQKQVNLVYYEAQKPVSGKEIVLYYYDEVKLVHVVKTGKTDTNGIFTAVIPGKADGSSYIFSFALSEKEIANMNGFRIPRKQYGGGQSVITIRFDKTYMQKNEGAPVQIMAFPNDGEPVNS